MAPSRRIGPQDFRFYLPKNPNDAIIYCFVLALICAEFLGHFLVTMPQLCGSSFFCNLWRFGFWLFLFVNVLGNLHMFCVTDSSISGLILPVVLKPGWRYCWTCEANCPPRSVHCAHCNRCILRQDHHCIFTGCCVGYRNARFFIILLFYLAVSALYFIWTGLPSTLNLITDELQSHSGLGPMLFAKVAFSLIMPLFSFLIGYVSFGTAVQCTLMSICIISSLICSFMCLFQLRLSLRNQTVNEWGSGKADYSLSVRDNFIQLFGHRFYATLLFAFVSSPLPLDGTEFPTAKDNVSYRPKFT